MEPDLSDENTNLHTQRKAKQNFLREEIVEQGYDPQLFTYYIDQKRGADIDLWTFEELRLVAEDFKLNYAALYDKLNSSHLSSLQDDAKENIPPEFLSQKHHNSPSPIHEKFPILNTIPFSKKSNTQENLYNPAGVSSPPLQSDSANQERFYTASLSVDSIVEEEKVIEHSKDSSEEDAQTDQKRYTSSLIAPSGEGIKAQQSEIPPDVYTRPARIMPPTLLSEAEKLEIVVADHEIVHKGLLSSNYVVYKMITQPMNWCVMRRYSDFTWLRDILSKIFPAFCLPPQPPKKSRGLLHSVTIHKRQAYLQRFMDSIKRNSAFLRCEILVDFLKETNTKTFEKFQVRISKQHAPSKLSDHYSVDGVLRCDPNPNSDYLHKMKEYFTNCETIQKKLKRASENVMHSMRIASDTIHQYAEMVRQLADYQSSIPMNSGNHEMYISVTEALNDWSRHDLMKIETMNKYFNNFFKYRYTETAPLKELLDARELKYCIYSKTESRLTDKKTKQWHQGDISKWEIDDPKIDVVSLQNDKIYALSKMFPKETARVNDLKDEFGYYNYQAQSEITRIMTDDMRIDDSHFSDWARTMSELSTQEHMIWTTLLAILRDLEYDMLPKKPGLLAKDARAL